MSGRRPTAASGLAGRRERAGLAREILEERYQQDRARPASKSKAMCTIGTKRSSCNCTGPLHILRRPTGHAGIAHAPTLAYTKR